jgi:glucose/arabinose dehydrogenase
MDAALTPVIGPRGLLALIDRSVHLTARSHGWMAAATDGKELAATLGTLKSVIAKQTSADAAEGAEVLLHTFHATLSRLIGPSLTDRLLRSVWSTPYSGTSAHDTLP